jgi:hypothetical protein
MTDIMAKAMGVSAAIVLGIIIGGAPVSADYKSPFRFTGTIKKVEVKLEDEKLTPAEQAEVKKMHAAVESARH